MKRLAIVVLIMTIVFLGLETAFSNAETKNAKPAAEQTKAAKPANKTQEPSAADNNEPSNEPNHVDEVEKEFMEASKAADREYQEATRQSTENRVKMMTAMQKQTVAELEFIHSLALQEGAVKTAKAVELAIEKRTARYDEMIQNIKDRQEREAARAEREAKREQRTAEREHPRRKTRQ